MRNDDDDQRGLVEEWLWLLVARSCKAAHNVPLAVGAQHVGWVEEQLAGEAKRSG